MSDDVSRPGNLLLVGISARALAESALHAGFRPRTVDYYGDLDQKRRVQNVALGRDLGLSYSAAEAARVAAQVGAPRAAYGADLENWPAAVARLARGRELLGNPPTVLRAVRDPALFFAALERAGLPTPATVLPGLRGCPRPAPGGTGGGARRWLRKPRLGGGGKGIALVEPAARPGPREFLQEFVEGPALGLAFLADGERVRPLALSLQLEDREAFGAAPFGYAGSLSRLPLGIDEDSVRDQAARAAAVVSRAFGLRGWNGMDFVVRMGEVVPLEINPRHTSSMELWDGPETPLFAAHLEACRGRLRGSWLPVPREVRGKAILFARRSVVVGESTRWLEGDGPGAAFRAAGGGWPGRPVADIPFPGERIERGQPVCSLYASGTSADECLDRLRGLARAVEFELDRSTRCSAPPEVAERSTPPGLDALVSDDFHDDSTRDG